MKSDIADFCRSRETTPMMTTTIDELNHLRATRMSRVANKLKSVSVSKVTALSDVEYNVYFLFVVI